MEGMTKTAQKYLELVAAGKSKVWCVAGKELKCSKVNTLNNPKEKIK